MLRSLKIVKIFWSDGFGVESLGFDPAGYCWNLGKVKLEDALYHCDVSGAEMRWPNGRIRLKNLPLRASGLSGRLLELR